MYNSLALVLAVLADSSSIHVDFSAAQDVRDDCKLAGMTFEDYIKKHKRTYPVGSEEYNEREALFEERSAEARSHNCRPGRRLWQAGVNFLSDRTDFELAKLRGRKGGWSSEGHPTSGGGSAASERLAVLESKGAIVEQRGGDKTDSSEKSWPASFSWQHLKAMRDIVDQGSCGSCWASATVKMLEAHAEIYQVPRKFSLQQIVSCAPNPEACGGNGGCNGSTGELALDYVYYNGLEDDSRLNYVADDLVCPQSMMARNPNPVPQPETGGSASFLAMRSPVKSVAFTSPARSFGMIGWSKLTANKLGPVMQALYQEGPIAVSITANKDWNMYLSGIMDCTNDKKDSFVVNHLVLLIGYGEEQTNNYDNSDNSETAKYWQVQNSWGRDWGEDGHLRLTRQDDADEQQFCGDDDQPEVGTGCKGGPSKVWVCGSCGILYDNVIPHFQGTTPMAMKMLERRSHSHRIVDEEEDQLAGSA
jgi:cathepsin L